MIILLWGGTVEAAPRQQGGGPLGFGQTVTGDITDEQYREVYLFNGTAGQVVSLNMMRQSGDLDPFLVLVTATGTVVAISDDDGNGRNAAINSQRLPIDSTYTVIATRFGHEHGTTAGEYSLRLENLGTSVPSNDVGTLIRYEGAVWGEITNEKPEDYYSFQAERGDVITIEMVRASGNLDTLIDLFNPAAQFLISGDDPSATNSLDAVINYTIPSDGIYFIRATRYGRLGGNTTGTYMLVIREIPVETLGTRPHDARYIEYGEDLVASINASVPRRYFQFEGRRGDIVLVVVTQTSGDLVPVVRLLNRDLAQISQGLSQGDEGVEVRIPGASIPEDGIYYVEVSGLADEDGLTMGEFSIELTGRAGISTANSLEVVYGGQLNGTIDNAEFAHTYVFVGRGGDIVTITMRQVEGDLDPLLTLRDETGKQIASNDDGFEGSKDAIIREFTLPVDGIYQIEASRYERVAGTTSGVYSLTIELQPPN